MKNYYINDAKRKLLYNTVFLPEWEKSLSLINYIEYYYPKGQEIKGAFESSNSLKVLNYKDWCQLTTQSIKFNDYDIPLGSTIYNWLRPDSNGADDSNNPSRTNLNSYLILMSAPLSIVGLRLNNNLEWEYILYEYSGVSNSVKYDIYSSLFRNFPYSTSTDFTKGSADISLHHFTTTNGSTFTTDQSTDNFFILSNYYYDSLSNTYVELNTDETFTIIMQEGTSTFTPITTAKIETDFIKELGGDTVGPYFATV